MKVNAIQTNTHEDPNPKRVMMLNNRPTPYFITPDGVVYNKNQSVRYLPTHANRPYVEYNDAYGHVTKRLDYVVAENYMIRPDDPIRLIHLDGNNFNCNVNNLKWVTRRDIINMYRDEYHIDDSIAMNEVWREIDTPMGKLEVSSFGRVKLYGHKGVLQQYNSHGYRVIYYIEKDTVAKKTKTLSVHQLVAQAFIPNPNNYEIVNHLDGNKANCHVYNLEWCDIAMNTEHGFLINNGTERFDENKLDMVGRLLEEGKLKHADIADITGINRKTISDIYRGRRHPELAAKYNFAAKKWNKDVAMKMVDLMNQGYRGKEVITRLGYDYDQSSISFYERVRREYRNLIKTNNQ